MRYRLLATVARRGRESEVAKYDKREADEFAFICSEDSDLARQPRRDPEEYVITGPVVASRAVLRVSHPEGKKIAERLHTTVLSAACAAPGIALFGRTAFALPGCFDA